ncbi:MAG: diguanylate cyclase [Campylobacterales bacterium]|nr:diguanylate cyclase [Campylobacterales bacterium]
MVFLILSLISYFNIQNTIQNIQKLSIEHLHSLGQVTKERIDQYLKQTEEQIISFNSRVRLRKTLESYMNEPTKEILGTLSTLVKSSYTGNGTIKDIIILDTNAKIIASMSNSIIENNFSSAMFDKSKNGIYSHLSFMDNGKIPILCIGAPIFDNNIFVGVSIFKIKIDYLNEILLQRTGLGKTGESLIGTYDENNNVVLFSPLKYSESTLVLSPSQFKQAIPMRLALENKVDKIENGLDYRNVPVISSMDYYEPLKIGIVVKKDIQEIMEPINKLMEELIIISIIGFILSIIISFLIARHITFTINKIVDIASSISEGNIHKRVEVFTNDELGILSHSINKMADSLVNMNLTLANKVHEQTIKLENANTQLENIFNITPNITLLTNGTTLIKANSEFYNFTGYKNLENFLSDYNCICDMFTDLEGYLTPIVEGVSWIKYVAANKEKIHKAVIEKDGGEYLFLVNATEYYENEQIYFIAVFENITELQKVAYTDHLTKLMNRIKIDEMLERCANSYKRYKNIYSVILLDIDHFKLVNDTYGHLVGDDVLKHVAKILSKNTRNIDLVGRWGGEEFLIITKETNIEGASALAEKIKKSVESYEFEIVKNQTISLGVAQIKENETIDELLKRADDALYEAKESGRNRVVVSN